MYVQASWALIVGVTSVAGTGAVVGEVGVMSRCHAYGHSPGLVAVT